jgi:Fe-S-cluster containining protein
MASKKSDKSKKEKKNKKQPKADEPWYNEGLQFECTQCGACCSGEPGYVWVEDSEIDAMAEELGMPFDTFERRYVRAVGKAKSLIEYADGDCILLDPKTRKCTAYGSRPIQCRTWPFWSSNLEKRGDWKETCEVCPGAGVGQLYTLEQIETARKQKAV